MEIANTSIITGIIIWLVIVVGGIVLQIYLSKRESRWPGMVLPSITFICSIFNIFGLLLFAGGQTGWITTSILTFFMMNIPTAVLLAVYAICREKFRRSREMNKMNIQDL